MMLKIIRRVLLVISLTITVGFLTASPAAACPEGHFSIGGGNGGWVSCAPIPGYFDQSPSSPQQQQPPKMRAPEPDSGALVWWNDASGIPSYSYVVRQIDSAETAGAGTLAVCMLNGGYNCRLAASTNAGGWLAIAQADDGSLFGDFGASKVAAEKAAQAQCAAAGLKCNIIKIEKNSA